MGKRQIAAQELAQENRLRQFGFTQNPAFLLDTQRRQQLNMRLGGIAFGQSDMVVVQCDRAAAFANRQETAVRLLYRNAAQFALARIVCPQPFGKSLGKDGGNQRQAVPRPAKQHQIKRIPRARRKMRGRDQRRLDQIRRRRTLTHAAGQVGTRRRLENLRIGAIGKMRRLRRVAGTGSSQKRMPEHPAQGRSRIGRKLQIMRQREMQTITGYGQFRRKIKRIHGRQTNKKWHDTAFQTT